jgi:hypothetical protein
MRFTVVHGRVRPARHAGSVDAFLEAVGVAQPGAVLMIRGLLPIAWNVSLRDLSIVRRSITESYHGLGCARSIAMYR